jgi:hypothetical protein
MPYCDVGDALLNAAAESLIIVHERDIDPYTEANVISSPIALFAANGESPVLVGTGGQASLSVTPSGQLFLRGVILAGTQNGGVGLAVNGGGAWVEASSIVNNTGGGISVDGGSLVLENCFVGGDQNDQRAVDVTDGTVSITYSTLAAGAIGASALFCDAGTNTTVRNSLLVARTDTDEVSCPNAVLTDNALEMSMANNTSLGSMPADTSLWFIGYGAGNFSLADAHPLAIDTAATWATGDPATDINGDARPTQDGLPDCAGADVVP